MSVAWSGCPASAHKLASLHQDSTARDVAAPVSVRRDVAFIVSSACEDSIIVCCWAAAFLNAYGPASARIYAATAKIHVASEVLTACEDTAAVMPSAAQQGLPIRPYKATILETIAHNDFTIIIGETGSGKTTQVAQMLDEAGYAREGRIAVTQPRRVAALSVARRVAEEMDTDVGADVGYSVRFEERTSSRTRVVYLTDGTLLREMLDAPELEAYSVIVLDEAHERSLNTDVLFGVLKGVVRNRKKPLKLILTSATLDAEKFSAYFFGCPVLHIPGRQYEVQIVFSEENHEKNYAAAAVDAALDMHLHQPPGDILVFLTGQAEIDRAVKQLTEAVASLPEDACSDLLILPLYAAMPLELQARVFSAPPEGCRRLIVATNIAETSITVDGVVYVVDPGVVKQKTYNPATGMETLSVTAISRVQATQRAGRAGRTRDGRCYRLYTQKYFERDMPPETLPEIQRTSMLTAVLFLKSLPLDIDVLAFDYLDHPGKSALEDALRQLYILGGIDRDGHITDLGRRMAALPVEPSVARTLIAAAELHCLPDALTVAAMLSAETIFSGNRGPQQILRGDGGKGVQDNLQEGARTTLAQMLKEGQGDHILLLRLYQGWERNNFSAKWCRDMRLDTRGMSFAREVRRQLTDLVKRADFLPDRELAPDRKSGKRKRDSEGEGDTDALRRALLIGFANHLARRMAQHNGYKTLNEHSALAQLHPSTAPLHADDYGLTSEYVIYTSLVATARIFLSKVCPVDSEWVQHILPRLWDVDVKRLSGGHTTELAVERAEHAADAAAGAVRQAVSALLPRKNDMTSVDAAKARYLARKGKKS